MMERQLEEDLLAALTVIPLYGEEAGRGDAEGFVTRKEILREFSFSRRRRRYPVSDARLLAWLHEAGQRLTRQRRLRYDAARGYALR